MSRKHALLVAALALFAASCEYENMYPFDGPFGLPVSCYDGDSYDGHYCRTDNDYFTVFLGHTTLSSADRHNISLSLDNSFDNTTLEVHYHTTGVFSGGSETDLIYRQVGTGVSPDSYGITFCDDAVSSTKCDQHYINFSDTLVTTVNRALACHETGHAVGLTHGAEADPPVSNTEPTLECMSGGTPWTISNVLGTQNFNMINSTY